MDAENKNMPRGWWTEEHCKEVALLCKSNGELQRKFSGAYNAARKNGWKDSYTWFEKKKDKTEDIEIESNDNMFLIIFECILRFCSTFFKSEFSSK